MRKTIQRNSGFTLVEILIVVAIIGILASVVLIQMNQSRNQGKDAVIKNSLMEVRKAAEFLNSNTGSYVGVCDAGDNTLINTGELANVEAYIGSQNGSGTIRCLESSTAYAVIASLNGGDCWCIDNQGASKKVALVVGETCNNKLATTSCPN